MFLRLETVCGIAGAALAWIKSYLADRKQAIKCGGAISAASNLTCGVPQKSVLGQLLFLVYTIGLDDVIARHDLKNHAYADDALMIWQL